MYRSLSWIFFGGLCLGFEPSRTARRTARGDVQVLVLLAQDDGERKAARRADPAGRSELHEAARFFARFGVLAAVLVMGAGFGGFRFA